MQALDEMVAELFRDGSPISTDVEPTPITSVDRIKGDAVQATEDRGNATTMADRPESVLDGLKLDTAIRLRWALRDMKAKRSGFSPISQDDLMALIDLELVEMRDETPVLTNAGYRALDRT